MVEQGLRTKQPVISQIGTIEGVGVHFRARLRGTSPEYHWPWHGDSRVSGIKMSVF